MSLILLVIYILVLLNPSDHRDQPRVILLVGFAHLLQHALGGEQLHRLGADQVAPDTVMVSDDGAGVHMGAICCGMGIRDRIALVIQTQGHAQGAVDTVVGGAAGHDQRLDSQRVEQGLQTGAIEAVATALAQAMIGGVTVQGG